MKRVAGGILGAALIAGVVWALLPGEEPEAGRTVGGRAGPTPQARTRVEAPSAASVAAVPSTSESVAASISTPTQAESLAALPVDVTTTATSASVTDGFHGVVRDSTGSPLGAVEVELLSFPDNFGGNLSEIKSMRTYMGSSGQWDLMFQPKASAKTDSEGRFTIARPEQEGLFQLRLSHEAFVVVRTNDFELGDYPPAGASFGLVPGASVEIQVVTPDGEPIAGRYLLKRDAPADETVGQGVPLPLRVDPLQAVQAQDSLSMAYGGGMVIEEEVVDNAEAKTKQAGAVKSEANVDSESDSDSAPQIVHGLPPGPHTVHAYAEGYAAGTAEVSLTAGTTQSVQVALNPGLRLSGRVIGPDGEAISGATVSGQPMNINMGIGGPSMPSGQSSATSGPDGQYVLEGLEDAQYYLHAQADGYLEDEGQRSFNGMPELHRAGQVEPVELKLARAVSIAGRVVGPTSFDGIQVHASDRSRYSSSGVGVNSDGTFEIQQLAPGRYELTANSGEWITFKPMQVSLGKDGVTGLELQLNQGQSITVHVRGGDQPIEGAQVQLSGGDEMFGRDRFSGNTSTTSSGEALLQGIVPGEYLLKVEHEDYSPASLPVVVSERGQREVRVELEAGALLKGRILAADGTPIAGQLFAIKSGSSLTNNPKQGASDEDGTFELKGLAAGDYDLSLMQMTGGMASAQVQSIGSFSVRSGQVTTQDFRLAPPQESGTLKGILLQNGDPLSMRPVQARSAGGDSLWGGGFRWFNTDEEGRFEGTGMQPGVYRVSSSGTDDVEVEIRANQTTEVVLETKSGVIAGQVLDQLGAPLANAVVQVRPQGAGHGLDLLTLAGGGRLTTDAQGSFSAEDLPAGTYRVSATGLGIGALAPVEVTLGDNESRTGLKLRLEPSPEVSLRVEGPDGAPLAGAEVTYYSADMDAHSYELDMVAKLSTDANGVALFEEIPPGDYVFAATSPVSGAAVSQRVTVRAGDELSPVLRLSAPGTLTVTGPPRTALRLTLSATGTPLPSAQANIWVSTNSEGSCAITNLAPAGYRVEATAADGSTLSWEGTVRSGTETLATVR